MAKIAKSLDTLRTQINKQFPKRSKVSDGWIGDPAHSARASDHNPDGRGIVCALDITHDPANGVDTWKMAENLRQNKDPRIKYVISNGRIFHSGIWLWRPYTGANKHSQHVHVSVLKDKSELTSPWNLSLGPNVIPAKPTVTLPVGVTADMRRRMARKIIDFEARRVNGKLAVYNPPSNDGGGAFEVAGINVKYHPEQATRLKTLIEAQKYDEAERSVADYLVSYTNVAAGWTTDAGVEFYLRDTVFNRGPTGAARILQRALGIQDDGQIGPTTRAAMTKLTGEELLLKLRQAREDYERKVVGYRANFWTGLTNRWNKALIEAQVFQKEQKSLMPRGAEDSVGAIVPVIGVGWFLWDWITQHPYLSTFIGAVSVGVLYKIIRWYRNKPNA